MVYFLEIDMIAAKEAVKIARDAYLDLYEDASQDEARDLQLEEVQWDASQNEWQVTLGFNVKNANPLKGIGAALGGERLYVRKYKLFHIDAQTGKVRSMKIREV